MKKIILSLLFALLAFSTIAQNKTPILRGLLQSDLDFSGYNQTNVGHIYLGTNADVVANWNGFTNVFQVEIPAGSGLTAFAVAPNFLISSTGATLGTQATPFPYGYFTRGTIGEFGGYGYVDTQTGPASDNIPYMTLGGNTNLMGTNGINYDFGFFGRDCNPINSGFNYSIQVATLDLTGLTAFATNADGSPVAWGPLNGAGGLFPSLLMTSMQGPVGDMPGTFQMVDNGTPIAIASSVSSGNWQGTNTLTQFLSTNAAAGWPVLITNVYRFGGNTILSNITTFYGTNGTGALQGSFSAFYNIAGGLIFNYHSTNGALGSTMAGNYPSLLYDPLGYAPIGSGSNYLNGTANPSPITHFPWHQAGIYMTQAPLYKDVAWIDHAYNRFWINGATTVSNSLTLQGTVSGTGNISNNLITNALIYDGVLAPNATVPTISATNAAQFTALPTITGNDRRMSILFTMSGSPVATTNLMTVSYATARPQADFLGMIVPMNNTSASLSPISRLYVTNLTTTSFQIWCGSALAANGVYQIGVVMVQ